MIKKFTLGILLLLLCISSSCAYSLPSLPAIYYGNIESSQNINGELVAKIDDKVVGTANITNNVFGDKLDNKLLINYYPEYEGKTITFYLNGTIKLNGSAIYHSGNVSKLSLYYTQTEKAADDTTDNNGNNNKGGSGGSSSSTSEKTTYKGIAKDIKSEKIKQIVYKDKLITGSNVDLDLSVKDLKAKSDLINKPIEIKEDVILVGGLVANPTVKKYQYAFKVKVTNSYPGKNKGVIQKQMINGHTVILLAGSDRYGTKAAVEYFKTLDDIPNEPIFVQWKDGKAVKYK